MDENWGYPHDLGKLHFREAEDLAAQLTQIHVFS